MKNKIISILKLNIALIFTAILVGIIVSFVAQMFAFTAKEVYNFLQVAKTFDSYTFVLYKKNISYLPLLGCIVAAFSIGILIKIFKIDRWQGPADTIYSAHQTAGTSDIKIGFLSTLTAFFSISGGASVGIYGPLVHFGGTLGAFLRRQTFIPQIPHDVIIGAGVAAAISAGFNSPIAGIVFSHEVVLRHFSMRALTAISLASISASFAAQEIDLVSSPLQFSDLIQFNLSDALFGLILVGLFSSITALLFMKNLLYFNKLASFVKIPFYYKPIIPGLICGIFATFLPEVVGLGSETVVNVISNNNLFLFLILILILKILLTSLCLSFGMFGGVLSPALLIGACSGALIFTIPYFEFDTSIISILAVSGMAAVSSSVIGAPITAIILVFELTNSYQYSIAAILPIALCNLITYVSFGSSLFDAQLKLRNISIGFGREYILMNTTQIGDFADDNYLKLNKSCSVKKALMMFKESNSTEGYFVDNDNKFLGKLKLIDIIGSKKNNAYEFKENNFVKLKPSNNINQAIDILSSFVGESVPIIDNQNKMLGIISESDVLKIYTDITNQIRFIEKS